MGMQNLCDNGAKIMIGDQMDGTFRAHDDKGTDIATAGLLGPTTLLVARMLQGLSLGGGAEKPAGVSP